MRLTPDGLAVSDDFDAACKWITDGSGSSLRFKFFSNIVQWAPDEEAEMALEACVWLRARCSRDLILREPDSIFEEPLWAQMIERAGGELEAIAREHNLLVDVD